MNTSILTSLCRLSPTALVFVIASIPYLLPSTAKADANSQAAESTAVGGGPAHGATAASSPGTDDQSVVELPKYVTVGSRFNDRLVTDSPVPVDFVSAQDLNVGGNFDFSQMMEAAIPSYNLVHTASNGASDFERPATLRGFVPGETLVLVDGIRLHTSSFVNNTQNIGRGTVSADLNTIPDSAIDHVEVLRDGASAQYGSDAIAGVINVVLDKAPGSGVDLSTGVTSKGDGAVVESSAYSGVPLGDNGILRATLFYRDHSATSRTGPDTAQQYFGINPVTGALVLPSTFYGSGIGLTPSNGILDPRDATIDRDIYKHYGDARYTTNGLFLNSESSLGKGVTFYSFGGYSRLIGHSVDFWRTPANDGTIRAFYPNGFAPVKNITLTDETLAAGLKGETAGGWGWNLSSEFGDNKTGIISSNNDNASMGLASPTVFNLGQWYSAQWTSNLDITKQFALGLPNPLKVAFGGEHRWDNYRLYAGDPASYENGGVAILDGPDKGNPAPVGDQVLAGLQPQDAVDAIRTSEAAYMDVENQITDRLLLSGAARYEDYSDFGRDLIYKAAARFELTKGLALRASVNTGFRAPDLAQEWNSNSATSFINGVAQSVRLVPAANPIAKLLGATPLKPEKSQNESAGVTYENGAFSSSIDFYRVVVDDQILLSSNFASLAIPTLVASQGYPAVESVSFETNAADMEREGFDLTMRYRFNLNELGALTATFSATGTKDKFLRVAPAPVQLTNLGITTPLLDLTQQTRLTQGQPRDKYILDLNWRWKKVSVNLRNILYGSFAEVQFTSLNPAEIAALTPGYDVHFAPTSPASSNYQVIQIFDQKTITDLDITYHLTPKIGVSIGANNLFDIYPAKNIASTAAGVAAGSNGADNFGTVPYPNLAPYGFNGTFLYTKLTFSF